MPGFDPQYPRTSDQDMQVDAPVIPGRMDRMEESAPTLPEERSDKEAVTTLGAMLHTMAEREKHHAEKAAYFEQLLWEHSRARDLYAETGSLIRKTLNAAVSETSDAKQDTTGGNYRG
jgi:hypothetical protein